MDKEEYLYETGEVYYVDFPYEEKDGKKRCVCTADQPAGKNECKKHSGTW